ncbi:hypothetical protein [Streptomyces zagrosensis]|uniref:Uncharacterized protein n=1 Tax=Streptomyces zagrosensis TaxID=1042984 RepID=A0A7W9UX42_9ACTN|nr:hypothetical protein [Streptomyces zagrosensis]MBB5934560.1 hypothetical protein [Streptomyces zagrosensis]
MTAADYTQADVTGLVKQWARQERVNAKAAGEHPPPYYSGLSDSKRSELHREAHYWCDLAAGLFLDQCVPPRPTRENVAAIRDHLTQCCARLRAMLDARGDMLPEGVRDQLGTAEQRVAMALDIVENAPAEWSREADAAWTELTRWARHLDMNYRGLQREPWKPDGSTTYGNG